MRMIRLIRGATHRLGLGYCVTVLTSIGMIPSALQAQDTLAVASHPVGTEKHLMDALLARRVTVHVKDVSRRDAIDALSQNAKVFIQYLVPVLTQYPGLVSIDASDLPLGVALERVLDGTPLRVSTDGAGHLTIVTIQDIVGDSTRAVGTVTGRVVDSATGRGLNGATLKVAGTSLSAMTQDSGRFTLSDVPAGQHIVTVRLFGYRPGEQTVDVTTAQTTAIRFSLVAVPNVLSGVVTTATGQQRKIEVGNDITTLNVDSIMRVAPITSVTDLLEGRVPGMTVQHSSGVPGNPSRVRIRGASSITGNNDPIVIVDGVRVYASQSDARNDNLANSAAGVGAPRYAAPSPLDQIDPNSIATIDVFKGPSASALYGSDAANGVIVITTKRGRAGPANWNVALEDGVNWVPGQWPVNYYRFGADALGLSDIQNGLCRWNDPFCKTDSLVAFQALNDPRYSVFSHGTIQSATVNVTGGASTVTYALTGSVTGTTGNLKLPAIEAQRYVQAYGPIPQWMLRPDNYQTASVSGQFTVQPSSAMQVTLSSNVYNSHQQQGSLQQAIAQLESQYISPAQLSLTSAPLITNDVERATDQQLTVTNGIRVTWQPYTWLPLEATGGLNTIQRTDVTYIPYGVVQGGIGAAVSVSGDTTGTYSIGHGTSQDQTMHVATVVPALKDRMTVAVGADYHSVSVVDLTAATDQLAPGVSTPTSFVCQGTALNASDFCTTASQSTAASSTYGWYVEPRLKLFNTYISPGFRLDGGSASGAQGGFAGSGLTGLPKIDLSYVAVDQSRPRGILTLLRPRVAFGFAGTQPGPTEKLRLLSDTTGTLNGTGAGPIIAVMQLGNTELRPETSRELEGGLDAELWNGRLTATWTGFNRLRNNAIISIPVAPSVYGNASVSTNIGQVRETGVSASGTAQLFQSRAFGWNVGGTVSSLHNNVVRLNPGQPPINTGYGSVETRIVAGYPLASRWALPIVSFADLNHNGIIEPNEIVYGDSLVFLGEETPNFEAHFTTGVTVLNGRLSVNAEFDYQNGLTQFNVAANGGSFLLLPNTPGTSLATQAAVVAANGECTANNNCSQMSGIGLVQTVNTFRFDALSVNYEIPRSLAAWFRVPRMTVALQGKNLGLHTNYRGKDPNVNAFSTVGAFGADETVDTGQLPQPRVWIFRLTLGS